MAARYMRLPVNKTGVYQNDATSTLEFWVFNPNDGRKKKIGECLMSAPQYMKDHWEKNTATLLKALVLATLFPDAHKPKRVHLN